MTDNQHMTCKNCAAVVQLNYCSNCGHPVTLKRINGHYLLHELEHDFHVERGMLYTIRELLIRPGETARHFLTENRKRLVKPIVFIILTSLFYSVVNHYFHIEEGYINTTAAAQKTAVGAILKWVQDHYGYANIIMGVFIAWWLKLFFSKYPYNVFEILILLCYVIGMGMFFFALTGIVQGLTRVDLLLVGSTLLLAYCVWAIAQFFDQQKPVNYLKALAAYLLGMVTFWVLAFIVGVAIDLALQ